MPGPSGATPAVFGDNVFVNSIGSAETRATGGGQQQEGQHSGRYRDSCNQFHGAYFSLKEKGVKLLTILHGSRFRLSAIVTGETYLCLVMSVKYGC